MDAGKAQRKVYQPPQYLDADHSFLLLWQADGEVVCSSANVD
jgi:hypothetical protein